VLGTSIPSRFDMAQNKWALAIKTGKMLEADYVLVSYRSMDMATMNFGAFLVNVNTGAVYSATTLGAGEAGMMLGANPMYIAQKIGRETYNDIIRKANKDLIATAARKNEITAVAIAKTKAPTSNVPTIEITSPDITRGVSVVSTHNLLISGTATAEEGVSEVSVNDKKAIVSENGNFSIELPLKDGANEVTVVAMDSSGNQGSRTFSVDRQQGETIVTEKGNATTMLKPGTYYALVIGNNNYKYISKLETARNDAVAMEKILKDNYGFKTKLLLDATRNDMLEAVNSFRRTLSETDSFLIYYAGHGEFDKRGDKAYWLPIDAQRDNDTNWIISDDLTTNMKRISSKHVLIVADSCYSGALTRNFNSDLKAKGSREEFLNKMSRKASRTLMASGGNEPVSDSGGSEHSVFADALLMALKEIEHRAFTAEELFHEFIKERVSGRSEQTPEYNTIRNSGHDGGDFVFEKR